MKECNKDSFMIEFLEEEFLQIWNGNPNNLRGGNMRKLATIQQITDIIPIEGKDKIALAQILGWQVIIQKDQFNIGDLCVYIECDSVLPPFPEFEFLRSKDYRIKTMKMAGVISQGICFPMSILQNYVKSHIQWRPGDDVTSFLKITQYEKTMDKETVDSSKENKSFLMRFKWYRDRVLKTKRERQGFPNFISKTDETRIQSVPHLLKMQNAVVTEKLDGQSCTYVVRRVKKFFRETDFEFMVCSRNLRLWNEDNSNQWICARKYNIKEKLIEELQELPLTEEWIAIQGECIAPGVQGNKYKRIEPEFYAFNYITSNRGRIKTYNAFNICENWLNIPFVPVIDWSFNAPSTVQEMLDYAHGYSLINPQTLREGVVVRSEDGKTSYKAVDPLFLMKYDE